MNILLICNKSPWPPLEGGPIAMNAMVEGLLEAGHRVKVLAINSNKYKVDVNSIPEHYRRATDIELVYIDLRIKMLPAFLNLFSDNSFHVERFVSKDFTAALTNILTNNQFDIIQLESLFISPYIPLIRQLSKAPVILRAHNIEHLIWERLMVNEKNLLKKRYIRHLTNTLKKYELEVCGKVDGIVAITSKDAEFFSNFVKSESVIAIPFGIQPGIIDKYRRETNKHIDTAIFHLGSMNWIPNQEGIKWFLDEVWPEVSRGHPELRFHLAGRAMPGWLYNLKDTRVIIDGEVPDAINYMHQYSIMVVPLFSGSGIRIKIIEGMMAGCAIVTTPIGAEGINCTSGEQLIITDSKAGFIDAIRRLINNPDYALLMGNKAGCFVTKHHNNALLIGVLETFYRKHLN